MTIRTTTTRKPRPIVITAIVVVFVLGGYFGAFYANLSGDKVIYLGVSSFG